MDILGLIDLPAWLLVLLTIGLLYYYVTLPFRNDYLGKQGIKGPRPYPFIGTMYRSFNSKGPIESAREDMETYGKVVRKFMGSTPSLMVADADLMKQIFVKEFRSFSVRTHMQTAMSPDKYMLESIADYDHWKHVRSILSPTFSGGKLRHMMSQVNKCAERQTHHLITIGCQQESIDVKHYVGCFSMDVIAATGFGLQLDSAKENNSPFLTYSKKILNDLFKPSKIPIWLLTGFAPSVLTWLGKFMSISFYPTETLKFFSDIVKRTIEQRKEAGMSQTDLLQLMVDVKVDDPPKQGGQGAKDYVYGPYATWNKHGLLEEEILANSVLTFLAGYETLASSLTFLLYNLALYPECQAKLHQEIVDIVGDQDDISYDQLAEMHYGGMCIDESLRLYPPAVINLRLCTEDVTINGICIKKGTLITFPCYLIHRDPDVWPDPEAFNPERFTAEAKASRDACYWQPFGVGPRNCVGMRLALLELKVALVHMVRKLEFCKCEQTETNIRLQNYAASISPVDPIRLKVRQRT